jgi:hypothetical protein
MELSSEWRELVPTAKKKNLASEEEVALALSLIAIETTFIV